MTGGQVTVRITVDGEEVYNTPVNTAQGTIYTSVQGSGTAEVCIYIDGVSGGAV